MEIRRAIPSDAKSIAQLMMLAMDDFVYDFIGEKSEFKGAEFLNHFIQKPNNLYSYENCWVVVDNQTVVGVANVYNGAKMVELRKPILSKLKTDYNSFYKPIDETEAGEYYIDAIAVDASQQGKGIGGKLIEFLIHKYVERQKETLGLLVDKKNPNAKRLYIKHGFEYIEDKAFGNKLMEHLQLNT